MNLKTLFDRQRDLDQNIIESKKLIPSTLFSRKILALLVELGEGINEWGAFKFWSNDQIPRRDELLEEIVDFLHFILSLGIEYKYEILAINCIAIPVENDFETDITNSFIMLYHRITLFYITRSATNYCYVFQSLVDLIHDIGFKWEEVEEAYENKNRINHLRQAEGY
ncbi:dUTP diphosphatase [Bacillus solitudinis]|uniref:dUTP diphosphatase n=1 Tax=Bacillus solitudinis TaxID=2014074 RepID=UPI000C2389F2|nr:dUTP diphosphatase [Bacillus solitudinis]